MLKSDEWYQDECNKLKPQIKGLQSNNPLGSIVICAYNEEDYLIDTLKGISLTKSKLPLEIIVVNNASSDRTKDILLQSGVKVVDENKKGISYARNCGLESSKGEFIFQTDADTIVPSTWVDEHYDCYKNEGTGGVSGPIKFEGVHYLYYLYRSGAIGFHILLDLIGTKHNSKGGANMSYRRRDALDLGGFELGSDLGEDVLLFNKLGKNKEICFPIGNKVSVSTSGRRYNTASKVFYSIKGKVKGVKNRVLSNDGIQSNIFFEDIRD